MGGICALVNPGTPIYIIYFLRTGLKATKCQFNSVAHSTCLQISLPKPFKDPYLRNFVMWSWGENM